MNFQYQMKAATQYALRVDIKCTKKLNRYFELSKLTGKGKIIKDTDDIKNTNLEDFYPDKKAKLWPLKQRKKFYTIYIFQNFIFLKNVGNTSTWSCYLQTKLWLKPYKPKNTKKRSSTNNELPGKFLKNSIKSTLWKDSAKFRNQNKKSSVNLMKPNLNPNCKTY